MIIKFYSTEQEAQKEVHKENWKANSADSE